MVLGGISFSKKPNDFVVVGSAVSISFARPFGLKHDLTLCNVKRK